MTVFVVIDDPYNASSVAAFSTRDLAETFAKANCCSEVEELVVDEHVGHKEYRVWTVTVEAESGKQLSETWKDTLSIDPPVVPVTRKYEQVTTYLWMDTPPIEAPRSSSKWVVEASSALSIKDALQKARTLKE